MLSWRKVNCLICEMITFFYQEHETKVNKCWLGVGGFQYYPTIYKVFIPGHDKLAYLCLV